MSSSPTGPESEAAPPAPAAQAAPIAPAASTSAAPAAPKPARTAGRRGRALLGVSLFVLVGAVAWWAYVHFVIGNTESTDNAYVQGNVVQITPQIAGTVVSIAVHDTDRVSAGQTLVELDPTDARLALDQAESQLAQTVREVRNLFANQGPLKAQIELREAELARAQADAERARADVARRQPLRASGAVGSEEFTHYTTQLLTARSAVVAAQAAVQAARQQLQASESMTDGITIENHPNVLRASARVREAFIAASRNTIATPVEGFVARRNVQLGERVQPGSPLMSVVQLDRLWVDANFKEGQLRNLRIGQPVTMVADQYGSKVVFHGSIEGLGAGTGAAFALLPAQNATGNWIKVVQRVPVRVSLDPAELAKHPLRVGLSMVATADVSRTDGPMLAQSARTEPPASTTLYESLGKAADREIAQIIARNRGDAPRLAPASAPVRPSAPRSATRSSTPLKTGMLRNEALKAANP